MELFSLNIENKQVNDKIKEEEKIDKKDKNKLKTIKKIKEVEDDIKPFKISRELKQINTFNSIEKRIIENFNKKKLHHATMFTGKYGIGKSTLSYWIVYQIILSSLKNDKNEQKLKEMHLEMLKNNIHPDVFFIELLDGENEIKIEQVRNFIEKISVKSTYGNKFVIIDDINSININGVNALLKTLEEPPENTYFFIINHQTTKLLDTIYSRCNEIKIKFNKNDCINVLEQSNLSFKKDEINFYSEVSGYSIGISNILYDINLKKIIEDNKNIKTCDLLNLIYKNIEIKYKNLSKTIKIYILENILLYFIKESIKNNNNIKEIVIQNNNLIKQFYNIKTLDLPVLFI